MVKFRRSRTEKENTFSKSHISIPAKDAIAIVPPKKVIKALYDWQAPESDPSITYLSFSQGDFLHVVSREDDPEWYEACNPLQGTRGLVPVKFFEQVGKTVRDSSDSGESASNRSNPAHDSGYAEKPPLNLENGNGAEADIGSGFRMSKAMAKGNGAMVYGIVMYDFKAERPDELEAKEGEAIIVIAQSNPEWFVAKPITRLGGPGLIPVSFIEVRDMTTGQPVPDTAEAVRRAGIPKVEEWKRMAAEYKNGSIPLGKLDSSSTSQLQQGMDRMSISSRNQSFSTNGYDPRQSQSQQSTRRSQPHLLAPVKASVPRYCFAEEVFWFIVEAQMEDGRHWCLSRLYQDFYDLQIKLIQEFPLEAGNVKGYERSLPYMPGPVNYVTDNISAGRRANLDEYIANLLKLGPHIREALTVRQFFEPRGEDYEVDPNADANYRLSTASQTSTQGPSQGASRQSSASNMRPNVSYAQPVQGHYRHESASQPSMIRQSSALTTTSTNSSATTAQKIKVWFEDDNCVVIRMPQRFSFADLYKKLKERRAMEKPDEADADLVILWRDEMAGGREVELGSDQDLAEALARVERLTLWVDVR